MRRFILLLVVIVFLVAVLGPVLWGFGVKAAQPPKPAEGETIMQKKLTNAQKLLEGIALADLDKVGQHARELSNLSRQAEFRIIKTPQYELHSNDFRRTLEDIDKGVKQKNIDAATLGYMDMTMSCVRCHKYVREVRITRKDSDPTEIRTGTGMEAVGSLR